MVDRIADVDACAAFAIIGAGRLGNALASRCLSLSLPAPVWSRRFASSSTEAQRLEHLNTVESMNEIAVSKTILSAIPNKALISLSQHAEMSRFEGVIVAMGIDTLCDPVRRAFPNAFVLRASPAIPQDGGEVRAIGLLEPAFVNDPRSEAARYALETLGSVSWIAEEQLYDLTTLLAGPLLTLIKAAVSQTLVETLKSNSLSELFKEQLEVVVLNELARRLISGEGGSKKTEGERSTPGGVTEIALRHCSELSNQLQAVIKAMQNRFTELRL